MPEVIEDDALDVVFCSDEDPPIKDFVELRFILKRLEFRNKFKDFLFESTL